MQDELRRWVTVASGLAELARNRAEEAVGELLQSGDGPPSMVRDVMERTKDEREDLLRAVRMELHNQLVSLGAATSRDVERLELALGRLETRLTRLEKGAGSPRPAAKKSTAKRSTAKKPTAGKASAKRSKAKSPAAGKSPAAKKGARRKTTVRRSRAS